MIKSGMYAVMQIHFMVDYMCFPSTVGTFTTGIYRESLINFLVGVFERVMEKSQLASLCWLHSSHSSEAANSNNRITLGLSILPVI